MTPIDIKIYSYRLKAVVGTKGIGEENLSKMVRYFAHYVMNIYGRMLKEEIESSKYKGNWEPIDDPGYAEYLGVTPEVPIFNLIIDALEVRKVGYNYIVGINPRYKYPGTSLSLQKVVRAIEYGTSKFNARPLVAKTTRKLNNNLMRLWKGYLKKKGVI